MVLFINCSKMTLIHFKLVELYRVNQLLQENLRGNKKKTKYLMVAATEKTRSLSALIWSLKKKILGRQRLNLPSIQIKI